MTSKHRLGPVGELDCRHEREQREHVGRSQRRGGARRLSGLGSWAPGRGRAASLVASSPAAAYVPAFTAKATEAGATASSSAPIPGPATTATSCAVCMSAFAGPSRTSPTSWGSSAKAAGFSAHARRRADRREPDHDPHRPVPGDDDGQRGHARRCRARCRRAAPSGASGGRRPRRRAARARRTGAAARSSPPPPTAPSASPRRRRRAAPRCTASCRARTRRWR